MSSNLAWRYLAIGLAMVAVGIYFVRRTRLGRPLTERDPYGFVFAIRLYVKFGAWVFLIGGLIVVFQALSILLSRH